MTTARLPRAEMNSEVWRRLPREQVAPAGIAERALVPVLRALARLGRPSRTFEALLVRLCHAWPEVRQLRTLSMWWTASLPPGQAAGLRVARIGARVGTRRLPVRDARLLVRLMPPQDQIYYTGIYEPAATRLLADRLRPGDILLDAGAGVGWYSILGAALGAEVHAFEPEPAPATLLLRSAALNGFSRRLTVNTMALAERTGRARLHRGPGGALAGRSSLRMWPHLLSGETLEVRTTSLDAYVRAHRLGPVRALKIDVEGTEAPVLAGARRLLLSPDRPEIVLCELWPRVMGGDPRAALSTLIGLGYRAFRFTPAGATPVSETDAETALPGSETLAFLDQRTQPLRGDTWQ